jgi:GYF domain 2
MDYHLHHNRQNLGIFPLEELRRRRQAGALTGQECVWCPGMPDWQTLDWVLAGGSAGAATAVQPAQPLPGAKPGTNVLLIVAVVVIGLLFLAGAIIVGVSIVWSAQRAQHVLPKIEQEVSEESTGSSAVELASEPVVWTTNSVTEAEVQKKEREFRIRQYLEGYEKRGERNPACDAKCVAFLKNWIDCNYGGPIDTNLPSVSRLSDELADDPQCTDPVILTVAAVNTVELHECDRRLERALHEFENSKHRAYPKFYATVILASKLITDRTDRLPVLDASALQLFKESFQDGSFRPEDQAEIANTLIMGWGRQFFDRNATAIYSIVEAQGKDFQWLALVLQGQYEINEAWKARGGGYANTVTASGWEGFRNHLAQARQCFTRAWELRPDLPLAPDRMMTVALGDSGLKEMRLWFDRTVAAQFDYPDAWSEMRWGLRPRWYGNLDAMLAFGVMAVNTKRFDTDIPRVLFDSISDMESELQWPRGEHIYGRSDIWPHLQQMYEGYITASPQTASRDGWRRTYASVAYLAGKYAVARQQLEALHWQTSNWNLSGWGRDMSLMVLEVAARTGPLAGQIDAAESARNDGDIAGVLQLYTKMAATTNADERTMAFVQDRLVTLGMEARLDKGEWVDFLPSGTNFSGWYVERGKCRRLPDGALEVESGEGGHLLYCRVQMGMNFEVKGGFTVVHSSTRAFQAGLVMGLPDFDTYGWDAFRIKRNDDEGDVVTFSEHWTKNRVLSPVALNSKTNSFDFRFQNDKVTAFVNGQEVFDKVNPPENYYLSTNEFLLGLGAFNDMNNTVIRYDTVKARKLLSP